MLKQFYRNEKGAYAVIFGLVSVFVAGGMATSVDYTGMLNDKARLADSLEQASLNLVTENNNYRSNSGLEKAEIQKRNDYIANTYASLYSTKSVDPNFKGLCEKDSKGRVICEATGNFVRHNLLPVSVQGVVFVPEKINVGGSGKAAKLVTKSIETRKEEKIPMVQKVPMDIMLVADFSDGYMTSDREESNSRCNSVYFTNPSNYPDAMRAYLTKERTKQKCTAQVGAVAFNNAINGYELPVFDVQKDGSAKNQVNRLAITPFSFGAQVRSQKAGSRSICVVPYHGIDAKGLSTYNQQKAGRDYLETLVWPKNAASSKSMYAMQPLQSFSSVDNMGENLRNALNSFDTLQNTGNYHYAYYIAKYLPLYVDVSLTIDAISEMNVDTLLTDTSTYRLNIGLNKRFCFGRTTDKNIELSSRWYTSKDISAYQSFVSSTLNNYAFGVANVTSGMIVGLQNFINLDAQDSPEVKAVPRQRMMIIVSSGAKFAPGYMKAVEESDWYCGDATQSASDIVKRRKCNNREKSWIKSNSRYYLDKSIKLVSAGKLYFSALRPYPTGKKAPEYEMDEMQKLFATAKGKKTGLGFCEAIRKRLDALDGEAYASIPRAKIIFVDFLNYRSPEEMDNWRSCADAVYTADNASQFKEALRKASMEFQTTVTIDESSTTTEKEGESSVTESGISIN
ncbi:hypothetical protein IX83_05810 [Basilea psittacipulmonis DSM 24701]|uniref:Uncharacterized protein n=2 Tax=Basilea TaxID=1472344 RepID=A0A077DIA7_9BURK|nr:hypothetical protein IX83_05810 [Basilea psittacipulmonis DSM 24701]